MAYERGGYAGKLGDRYELLWAVRQLLLVLAEQTRSVELEPVGPDERGVDLWIEHRDGTREAQQCKGELGVEAKWTMASLHAKGILKALAEHLGGDPRNRFRLVSSVPATVFTDLCRSARDSKGDPLAYYEHQVKGRGVAHSDEFAAFCRYLNLDVGSPQDLAGAYDLLRRSDAEIAKDNETTRQDLRTLAGLLVEGDPANVVSALYEWSVHSLRRVLRTDDVAAFLRTRGFEPRDLAKDSRTRPAVEALRRVFSDSIRPYLAAGVLIERAESKQVLEKVLDVSAKRLVLLHGRAAAGKSGVLYEVAQDLERRGVPILPLRLDRQPMVGPLKVFGERLGLPDSPVACLRALVAGHRGVFLVDQVDALRWTSGHSAEAWQLCQEMISQALSMPDVVVVIGCRTFDLEHDPQIRRWISANEAERVEVGELPEPDVKTHVGRAGACYEPFTPREKRLLHSVGNLALWSELASQAGPPPRFRTSTDLMRALWEQRFAQAEAAGIPPNLFRSVLDKIVQAMDRDGSLSIPQRLIPDHESPVLRELASLNILALANGRISFTHQTLLDYRVADRLVRDVLAGEGSLTTWLGGPDQQSIFRREQLRLILAMLRDDDPTRHLEALRTLLGSATVRFHLKQLTLQHMGEIEEPTELELDLVADILKDPAWRPHILGEVTWRRAGWFAGLHGRGLWRGWLASGDDELVNAALLQQRVAHESCGAAIAELLAPYESAQGDWPQRCAAVLPYHPEDERPELFDLRVRLVQRGLGEDLVDWARLAKTDPVRCVRLLEAHLRRRRDPRVDGGERDNQIGRQRGLQIVGKHHREPFASAGRTASAEAWTRLVPLVEAKIGRYRRYRRWRKSLRDRSDDSSWMDQPKLSLPGALRRLLVSSGRAQVGKDPAAFLARPEVASPSSSWWLQRIIAASLLVAPSAAADAVIGWLLAKPTRFRLGRRRSRTPWGPARKLIERFAPHCSDGVFRALETWILMRHEPEEMRELRYRAGLPLDERIRFLPRFGQVAFHLLPALPPSRMSAIAVGHLGALGRKFVYVTEDFFQPFPRSWGRASALADREARLARISDKAWLDIISSAIADHGRGGTDPWDVGPKRPSSDDLGWAARREPARFAELARRFPQSVPSPFVSALIRGVALMRPPDDLNPEQKAAWQLATTDQVTRVLALAGDDRDEAMAFLHALHERRDMEWSREVLDKVLHYAVAHPDPAPGEWPATSSRAEENPAADLEASAINSVRGWAAGIIEMQLFDEPQQLTDVVEAVERLVENAHPAIRAAAIGTCGPILNIDKDLAVRLFLRGVEGADDRLLACRDAQRFIAFAARSHIEQMGPVIRRMIASPLEKVAEEGAAQATARWLFEDTMEEDAKRCLGGSPSQRRGVAEIAMTFAGNSLCASRCVELLTALMDDPDVKVLEKVSRVWHQKGVMQAAAVVAFAPAFLGSAAFRHDPSPLLHALSEHGTLLALDRVALGVCDVFAGPLAAATRDLSRGLAHDAQEIGPLLLRLYEQAHGAGHRAVQIECLDRWDALLQNRVGNAHDLMREVDR